MSSKVQYNKLVKGMKKRGWKRVRAKASHEVWIFGPTGIQMVLPKKRRTELVGEPFLRQIKQAEEGWLQSRARRSTTKKAARNPQKKAHRRKARVDLSLAKDYLEAAQQRGPAHATGAKLQYVKGTGTPEDVLENLLSAIRFSATAAEEAHHAKEYDVGEEAVQVGGQAMKLLRRMLASKNPADIPGGNMTECIRIMEARGDVRSPGALCNWLQQKAGGYGHVPKGNGGTRKAKSDQRKALRSILKGT